MPLSSQTIYSGDHVQIRQVHCCAEHSGLSPIEYSESDALVFPLSGGYSKHVSRGRSIIAKPLTGLIFAEGRPHKISHPLGLRDQSLVLEISHEIMCPILEDLCGVSSLSDKRLPIHVDLSLEFATACNLLVGICRRGVMSALHAEEVAVLMFAQALGNVDLDGRGYSVCQNISERHRDLSEGVRIKLARTVGSPPSLTELADELCVTPYHLARIFRRITGVTIHEYGIRLRLAEAVNTLISSTRDVSDIALDYGFSSHSHFTYALRRRIGITPSDLRQIKKSQMSKILTVLQVSPG